jgi:hypothetical protein
LYFFMALDLYRLLLPITHHTMFVTLKHSPATNWDRV